MDNEEIIGFVRKFDVIRRSQLQIEFKIGYNYANKIIAALQKNNIIGERNMKTFDYDVLNNKNNKNK